MSTGLGSNFLPFRGGGARFHNFAILTELVGFVVAGHGLEVILEFVNHNVLSTFSPQCFYILKHREGETWRVTQTKVEGEQELRLSPQHAISVSLESGAVGVASTGGWELGMDEGSMALASESYRLLLIPLIDNLVPQSVLVAVIRNSGEFSPSDIELFSYLQAVISFVAYGSKPLDQSHYDF